MNRCRIWVMGAVIAAIPLGVKGGTEYEIRCGNPPCGLSTNVSIGRGMAFYLITGYCRSCRGFVCWSHGLDEKGPAPVGSAWNWGARHRRSKYPCPKCQRPFVEIPSERYLNRCPACGSRKLISRPVLYYD